MNNGNSFDIVAIIALISLIYLISQLLRSFVSNKARRKYSHIRRTEIIRKHFAEIRNQLLQYSIHNKIDINSVTFQSLYQISTLIMRSPDRYELINDFIHSVLIKKSDQQHASSDKVDIFSESEMWSDELRQLVVKFALGFVLIMVEYSSLLRFVNTFIRTFKLSSPEAIEDQLEKFEARKDPIIKNLHEGKANLLSLATA